MLVEVGESKWILELENVWFGTIWGGGGTCMLPMHKDHTLPKSNLDVIPYSFPMGVPDYHMQKGL